MNKPTLNDLIKAINNNEKYTDVLKATTENISNMYKEELSRPINSIGDVAIILCILQGILYGNCSNCPVEKFDYDKRTEYEKQCLHATCQEELYKWLLDKAEEEKKENENNGSN